MNTSTLGPYPNPQALNRALTDVLRTHARERPGISVDSLRRQFAYDRLLTRVFTRPDAERWVLKGATAMLARLAGDARHTRDIDLYRVDNDLIAAESALRSAAAADAGDFFRFALSPARRITQDRHTLRVPVVAHLGVREYSRFHVDLVTDLIMTAPPDEVTPLLPLALVGAMSTTYRAYPIADHIADKVCAMIEVHVRADGRTQASTRYHDLADLATFARTATLGVDALTRALGSEATRRGLELPTKLSIPDPSWRPGYAQVARDNPRLVDRNLAQALAVTAALIDPILAARATGTWDPARQAWCCP